MTEKIFYIYIMASNNGTLYIGITNNLIRRAYEYKEGVVEGFTKQYDCKKLVYFEQCADAMVAITREKQLKNWRREKKEALIKSINPGWRDLSLDF